MKRREANLENEVKYLHEYSKKILRSSSSGNKYHSASTRRTTSHTNHIN